MNPSTAEKAPEVVPLRSDTPLPRSRSRSRSTRRQTDVKRFPWLQNGRNVVIFGSLGLMMWAWTCYQAGRYIRGSAGDRPSASYCHESMSWTTPPSGNRAWWATRRKEARLALPLDAEWLSFIAEGGFALGTFQVSPTAPQGSGEAVVDVGVSYDASEAFADMKTCKLRFGPSDWGLGIFTPVNPLGLPSKSLQVHVDIHLRLPPSSPLELNGLKTQLPYFSHDIEASGSNVSFASVRLHAEGGAVRVHSLSANQVLVRTKNAPILATLDARNEVQLETANAAIVARVNLSSTSSEPNLVPSRAMVRTSRGEIDATFSLHALSSRGVPAGTGGAFSIEATTERAPLTLSVDNLPVDAPLTLNAETTRAGARVALPPAYEGAFVLEAERFANPPEVRWPEGVDDDTADPAGRGRVRSVVARWKSGLFGWSPTLYGNVVWGGREEGVDVDKGRVLVRTSAPGRARLNLGGEVE